MCQGDVQPETHRRLNLSINHSTTAALFSDNKTASLGCGVHEVYVVQMMKNEPCLSGSRLSAPNSGGRTPGSKLPESPPPLPRPDGGGTPGRVPVYTAQKKRHASGHVINLSKTMSTAEPHRNCTVWTSQGTCVAQQRAC